MRARLRKIGMLAWACFAATPAWAAPPITALCFVPDGSAVIAGSQAGLGIRSWPALEPIALLSTKLTNIHDISFSLAGRILAVAGGIPGEYGTVELYHWPQRKLFRQLSPHEDLIYDIHWRSDSQQLALASADQTVSLHGIEGLDSEVLLQGHSRAVLAVAYLPDGKLLTAGVDATIRLWDTSERTPLRSYSNHTRPINALALRSGTRAEVPLMVASASDDRTVRFWQPTIGRLVRFARFDSVPLAIAWTPDGRTLWAAFRDGHVREIDPTDASVRRAYPAIEGPAYALAVGGDGTLAVGGSDGQLRRISPQN